MLRFIISFFRYYFIISTLFTCSIYFDNLLCLTILIKTWFLWTRITNINVWTRVICGISKCSIFIFTTVTGTPRNFEICPAIWTIWFHFNFIITSLRFITGRRYRSKGFFIWTVIIRFYKFWTTLLRCFIFIEVPLIGIRWCFTLTCTAATATIPWFIQEPFRWTTSIC